MMIPNTIGEWCFFFSSSFPPLSFLPAHSRSKQTGSEHLVNLEAPHMSPSELFLPVSGRLFKLTAWEKTSGACYLHCPTQQGDKKTCGHGQARNKHEIHCTIGFGKARGAARYANRELRSRFEWKKIKRSSHWLRGHNRLHIMLCWSWSTCNAMLSITFDLVHLILWFC